MADHQPPVEESAMAMVVADQQKPPGEETAMAMVVADQQKPGEVAAAVATAARYRVKEVVESVAFLKDLTARLDAFPTVRDGIVDLLIGYGSSGGAGDKRAVTSRAAGLLAGHPDVLDTFTAFLAGAKPPAAPPLAVTRPRRATARRPIALPAPPPSPEQKPGAAGGGRRDDDPRVLEALAFLDRVGEIAGREVGEKFAGALDAAWGNRGMDAGEIYGGVRDALGPAHAGLLAEFAAGFLPGKLEWAAEERRRTRNRRRAEARAAANAAAADQKPLLADDDGKHGLRADEISGVQVKLEIVKKRRAGAGAGGEHIGHDGGDDYAPWARTKKPRAGADAGAGDVHGNNGEKKPRRRGAPNGGGVGTSAAAAAASEEKDALFRRFRELWVFYTRYSTLVGTMEQAKRLLRAAAAGGGFPATVEEMFPRRESLEFLASYYGGGHRWGKMRAALEGERAAAALRAMLESLERKEEEAVAQEVSERRRQDAARAAQRIFGLAVEKVRQERRMQRRKDAGDGGGAAASGHQACPRR